MSGPGKSSIVEQVRNLVVAPGQLAFWSLGQQGYLMKGGDHVLIIDPYLSNYITELPRMVPIVVQPSELDMVNVALATHHHADHCDPLTLVPLLAASPRADIITSYTGKDVLVQHGADPPRITVPTINSPIEFGDGLRITAIPSAHYGFDPDENGNPAFLGFIIRINGVTVYHSGDSIIYSGLTERLQQQPLDVLCLPINGRDWFREQQDLVGNMDYREAAELTVAVHGNVLLPGHNDMFAGNSINPSYLVDYLHSHHPAQRAHILQAGELYLYVKQN